MSQRTKIETFEFVGLGDDDPFDDEPYCQRCNGTGWICVCPDDMCRSGEPGESCIHGDGDVLCPDCGGRNAF